jgi:hypothetical protein
VQNSSLLCSFFFLQQQSTKIIKKVRVDNFRFDFLS